MNERTRYIVQDLDTLEFLCPSNGEVGSTPFIARAGHFESYQTALEVAIDEVGEGFTIFKFCLPDDESEKP